MSKNQYADSYAPPCAIDSNGNRHSLEDGKTMSKYHDELLEYIQTGLNNEKTYLRSCRAWKKAELGMGVLYGDIYRKEFKGPSTLQIRKSRRQTRELIANQSDIRQSWQIRTTKPDDVSFQDQANDYNDLSKDWWTSLFVDRIVKEAEQYAGGYGTGYIFLWPDENPLTKEIDIIPTALDYKSVLVGHISTDNDLQKAQRVDVVMEYPLPTAHRKFPDHAAMISADTEIPSRMARTYERTTKMWRGLWAMIADRKKNNAEAVSNPFPCARIYYSFIDDDTVNDTGKTVCMGEVGAHWYYEVPSLYLDSGELNQIGTNTFKKNDVTGENEEIKRFVKREDCRLFPNGRLVISCTNGIIYDGPPQWGEGLKPIIPFYFDRVAGELLGFPVAMDSIAIEDSVNNIYQAMEDMILGKVNPPIGIDSSVPDTQAAQIKTLGIRGMIGKGIQYSLAHIQKAIVPLTDPSHWIIDSAMFKFLEMLQAMQDYLSGSQDWAGMAQMKQAPSDDTQEALLQKLGILSIDQARDQERSFMYMGALWLSYADQVYTIKRRLQILGPRAIAPHYVDFDPAKMERVYENDSRPRWLVRREYKKNFSAYVSANSVQQRQSMQNKLASLQLQKMGNTGINDKMVYDLFVGDDKFEENQKRFFEDQKKKALAMAEIQVEVQKMMQAAGLGGGSGEGNSIGIKNPLIQQIASELAAKFGAEGQVGRPPTNTAPASLEQKTREGIPDVTLATS